MHQFLLEASNIGLKHRGPEPPIDYQFTAKSQNDTHITLFVNLAEDRIGAVGKFEISDEAIRALDPNGEPTLPAPVVTEFRAIRDELKRPLERLVTGLKYYFNDHRLSEQISTKLLWLSNCETLVQIGLGHQYFLGSHNSSHLEDESAAGALQEFLGSDKAIPISGLRHLHRAWSESNPAFMWIDATIAAELAAKECLVQLKPEIKTILLELQSPPLDKLYGVVLESIVGARSSKLKEIRNGMAIRNKLIHRPASIEVDLQDAMDYVEAIEIAIFELMSFMYPKDPIVERVYKRRVKFGIIDRKTGKFRGEK